MTARWDRATLNELRTRMDSRSDWQAQIDGLIDDGGDVATLLELRHRRNAFVASWDECITDMKTEQT